MESVRNAQSIQQLTELANYLPALSSSTPIKAYYDSSSKLLHNAEEAHKSAKIDEEYLWLFRFVILIFERIPQHEQHNKTEETKRLHLIHHKRCKHVLNRLEVLKVELIPFYEEKARRLAEELEEMAMTTNPRAKPTKTEIPTEDQLLARLSRLNQPSAPKPTASVTPVAPKPEEAPTTPSETPQILDLSIFDAPAKDATSTSSPPVDEFEKLKLIPDVEIKDERLDLSWLEDDPTFGSKNRKLASESASKPLAPTSYPSISALESDLDKDPVLPDWISRTLKKSEKPAPPSYDAARSPKKIAPIQVPEVPKPSTKYSVVTVVAEPEPPVSSPFSLPASLEVPTSFSFLQTMRGQQFDPEAMNRRLLETTVGATCADFIISPSDPLPSAPVSSPSPNQSESSNSSDSEASGPRGRTEAKKTSSGALPASTKSDLVPLAKSASPLPRVGNGAATPSSATQGTPKGQFVPVVAGVSPTYLYQPSPTSQSRLPLLGNVPVVFRPNQLNMFDPSKAMKVPSTGSIPTAASASTSSPLASPISPASSLSERPPKYKKSASPTPSSSVAAKASAPSYASAMALKAPSQAKTPVTKAASTSYSGAFPLMTNQRPGAAVDDVTLRKIEMDGDMFDKFMASAHRNTVRSIETCGILAGTFLAQKQVFRVTHLIIPKQTGTTDTCATTNEDEIFEYQINNDLLTLGWIHTHPTQACFLSSVDLHTHCSYQALFPEAVAVVIAPRDTPSFSFFHLSPSGFQIVQSCPLKGFHHHPERGLYQACSHVQLTWNNKKPCKVVDMR